MKVLAFAAALRKGSYNRILITQAVKTLRSHSELTVDHRDFREFEMPIYDGDTEEQAGIPAGGQKLIDAILSVDAIVISTPEYNGGIPGTLKNAVDWVSRHDPIPLDGKPVLLLSASPGVLGGVRGLWHTRVPFEAIGSYVYPEMFGLQKAGDAFDSDGQFKDPRNARRLESLIGDFILFSERLSKKT